MLRLPIAPAALIVAALAVSLVGCTPTPEPTPSASPSESPSASESATPSATPTAEPIALPDCGGIYSPALVASLTAEGRTSIGDVSGPETGGWGTADTTLPGILASLPERVSCTWILPATESGSTTSIARLDAASRTAVIAALVAGGYTASTIPQGELYSIAVELEIGTYNESHLLTDEFWFASYFSGGQAESLTLDAAALLLP